MAKIFTDNMLAQLRGYARGCGATIAVVNPYEFIMVCTDLAAAQAAADKFSNAALAVIGYGEAATQVRFTPR